MKIKEKDLELVSGGITGKLKNWFRGGSVGGAIGLMVGVILGVGSLIVIATIINNRQTKKRRQRYENIFDEAREIAALGNQ
jgi:hypothetical protein